VHGIILLVGSEGESLLWLSEEEMGCAIFFSMAKAHDLLMLCIVLPDS